jgi:hypothetical protein
VALPGGSRPSNSALDVNLQKADGATANDNKSALRLNGVSILRWYDGLMSLLTKLLFWQQTGLALLKSMLLADRSQAGCRWECIPGTTTKDGGTGKPTVNFP